VESCIRAARRRDDFWHYFDGHRRNHGNYHQRYSFDEHARHDGHADRYAF
jgi:hypothetical protein